MNDKPLVVACIPAFNEEKAIASVIVQSLKFVDRIIVCDDGSSDLTGEISEALGAIVIRHERNMGYGASVESLFREALRLGADIAITLDGDGQHNPLQIPRLVKPLVENKADIVIGSRFLRKEDAAKVPRYRKVGLKVITSLVSNTSFNDITDAQSGFRAYNRKALQMIKITEQDMSASTEILLKANENALTIVEVPVTISYMKDASTHNPVIHGLNVVLSTIKHLSMRRPLVFYGIPGFVSLLIGFYFWVWSLQIYRVSHKIITNITLIALSATMVGLMLMTTAVILWVLISVMRESASAH